MVSLMVSARLSAQDAGYWRAASSSARTFTGDIVLSSDKIAIGFSRFTIAQIRPLQPAEAAAVFDAGSAAPGAGNLYRTSIPAEKHFSHHNTLCGSDETQWVVTWAQGHTLQLAFFSGSSMPDLTPNGLANASSLCGTYTYER